MSKFISVFEKLNLVEKVNDKVTVADEIKNIDDVEQAKPEQAEVHDDKEDLHNVERHVEKECTQRKNELAYEKNLTIQEIYSLFGIENSNINTIFMLGNFINALPESLPHNVKKQSVMNIIDASNTDLNKLLSDGDKRLSTLNQFTKEYHNSITKIIEQYKAEIIRLNNLIDNYKNQIHIKENMLEEQNNIIKYETEKISGIVDFFKKAD